MVGFYFSGQLKYVGKNKKNIWWLYFKYVGKIWWLSLKQQKHFSWGCGLLNPT